jgi:eukaryotic-like serine/threonine-protein kinase
MPAQYGNPDGQACPDAGLLQAFHVGQLPAGALEAVGTHLLSCTACGSILEELAASPSNDPLFCSVKQCFQPWPLLEENGFARLVETAKRLPFGVTGAESATQAGTKSYQQERAVELGKIASYQLLEVIGEGGMGIVYRALQCPVGRTVALKMIRDARLASHETLARFRTEGKAIARLAHPNVVALYDFGEHDGRSYFTMELLGDTLAARLARGPLPWREAARLLADLAGAMAAVHGQQVYHRDLKPSNVLFDARGIPKITDFGLAKLADADDRHTRTDAVLGTAQYMAPEQAAGRTDATGPGLDIYALGVILYEAVTGRPPFRGSTNAQTRELVQKADPVSPRRLCPELPRDLEAVCLKCLEKAADQRYLTCSQLAEDLECVLRGEPSHWARPPSRLRRAWRHVRRHPVVATAILLLAIGLAAVYLLHPQRTLERINAELERGNRVVLLDRQGSPRWSECVYGKPQISEGADGTYSILTEGLCLLELLPEPCCDSYCIRAKVKHQMSDIPIFGEAGIYVGRKAHPGEEVPIQVFLQMTYDDLSVPVLANPFADKLPPGEANENAVTWGPRIIGGYRDRGWDSFAYKAAPTFAPGGVNLGWRELVVVVRPDGIEGWWQGRPASKIAAADIAQWIAQSASKLVQLHPADRCIGDIDPAFVSGGGLGLYVRRGAASFCEVSVTPLTSASLTRGSE